MYTAVGQIALGDPDVSSSCPWPWETPVCPPACYCDFYGLYYARDEVYVFRAVVRLGQPIDKASKALLFGRALGEAFVPALDVRGVALSDLGDGSWQVEIVYTAPIPGAPLLQKNDAGLREAIETSSPLRAEFPGLQVVSGKRLQLLAPEAIAFWLSAPVLWSSQSDEPTQAFARGEGVWLGTAAQRQVQLQPQKPVPVGPAGGGGVGGQLSTKTVVGVIVIGAVLWAALRKRGSE